MYTVPFSTDVLLWNQNFKVARCTADARAAFDEKNVVSAQTIAEPCKYWRMAEKADAMMTKAATWFANRCFFYIFVNEDWFQFGVELETSLQYWNDTKTAILSLNGSSLQSIYQILYHITVGWLFQILFSLCCCMVYLCAMDDSEVCVFVFGWKENSNINTASKMAHIIQEGNRRNSIRFGDYYGCALSKESLPLAYDFV